MAVAALTAVESVMYEHSLLNLVHLNGLIGVLKHSPPCGPVSEMSRQICEYYLCDVYVAIVMRGVASPFEVLNPRLYRLEEQYAAAEKRLRTIGNGLTIRLPRLILLVRNVCQSSKLEPKEPIFDALGLARELFLARDDSAENQMLHTVRVIKVTSEQDSKSIKFCYGYSNHSIFKAGALYWHTHATLLRLILRLSSHTAGSRGTSSGQIVSELQRCVSNLVMSAPYAKRLTLRTNRRLFSHMMVVCWGALRDCPEAMPRCARDSGALFAWLLANANRPHPADAPLTSADIDRIAEVFAGGPLACSNAHFCGLARVDTHSVPPPSS
jgi:hypothetical protein